MSILNKILDVKKEEVAELHKKYSRESFSNSPLFNKQRKSFSKALVNKEKVNVIAEVKKASPSKGVLKEDFDHRVIAETYMQNGADAISVLTDKQFFQGDILFLKENSAFKTVPLLRKDFIIDEFQILEAKANGADAILLIAEALSKKQIEELSKIAFENDLEVLLEIHSARQLEKIDFELNKIIGINNRNLETFEVNIAATAEIISQIPDEIITVSESGISTKEDVEFLKKLSVDSMLVGEHFMKSGDLGQSLQQLIKWCKYES